MCNTLLVVVFKAMITCSWGTGLETVHCGVKRTGLLKMRAVMG